MKKTGGECRYDENISKGIENRKFANGGIKCLRWLFNR